MTPHRRTVLLVEDDAAIRRIAVRLLERAGLEVVQAGDGEEGLARWREHRDRIGVVVTDVMMPRLSGRDLIAAVLAEDQHVRFVLMTGLDSGDVPGDTAGIEILMKPWEGNALLESVRRALGEGA
ncbi:MAG TPA: response regulator [Gemmatimonadales bacterium]|nr:response regulator [Gemmatimonadales bacterium]